VLLDDSSVSGEASVNVNGTDDHRLGRAVSIDRAGGTPGLAATAESLTPYL
jgi:hypothetical protein